MDQPNMQAVDSVVDTDSPDGSTESAQSSHRLQKIGITAAAAILSLAIGIGSILTAQYFNVVPNVKPATTAPTPTPNQHTPTPTPTADPTAKWPVFTTRNKALSLKYPPTWKVSSKLVTNPAEGTPHKTNFEEITVTANNQTVAWLGYPFEYQGCNDQYRFRSYQIGEWPVIMTANCKDDDTYLAFFKAPMINQEPQAVNIAVAYYYSPQVDSNFRLLAKSITGLKTLVSCIECKGN
jgi:hypothetical protein